MKFRSWPIAILSLVAFSRVDAAPAPATPPTTEKVNGLLSNSPFGSPKTGVLGANSGAEPFEFRAVLEENGSKFFSIYETATKRSNWVEINDPVNGFSVKGYDGAKENITVEYQGKVMTLAIKRAPAVPQAIQQPMPVPGQNGVPAPGPVPGQVGPTTADQQRIQQIQEEIRRRRALRNQAATPQPGTNAGPQPMPPNSAGPVPQPGGTGGPQLIPPKN